MGKVKAMWMGACEKEVEGYAIGRWPREDAYTRLVAFGVDPHDAANMLDAVKPTDQLEPPAPDEIETVVAAACLYKGTVYSLPPPARHHTVMRHIFDTVDENAFIGPDAQGFITNQERFVSRTEALGIVKAAGQPQIDHPALNVGGRLFSEDLW